MAIYQCKICGGTLDVTPGSDVGVCEYCGTRQTVPSDGDGQRVNLYNRANHLRQSGAFDKAAGIYETILAQDPQQAEAAWCLLLCSYGVSYVEDPKTGAKKPTCNRLSHQSVLQNEYYLSALQLAAPDARAVYEAEGKEIERIRQQTFAVAQQETPYDVFLCYKQSDETGARTQDSVLAADLYQKLTKDGYRVFFAERSLADKLGEAYEPYIFAALSSAKVMLVIATQPAYPEAVWVKNEWSRFLALAQDDNKKLLIPCCSGMPLSALPPELRGLQAQDMEKLGFYQELLRAVTLLCGDRTPAAQPEPQMAQKKPLLDRAFLFLEDGDWASANAYCEKVLDLDARCAEAYLGKLMAELQIRRRDELQTAPVALQTSRQYEKVLRFADPALAQELSAAQTAFQARQAQAQRREQYGAACALFNAAATQAQLLQAKQAFSALGDYADAQQKAAQCDERCEALAHAAAEQQRLQQERQAALQQKKEEKKQRSKQRRKAAIPLVLILALLATLTVTVFLPNYFYHNAMTAIENGDYTSAYRTLRRLRSFKDSAEQSEAIRLSAQLQCIANAAEKDEVTFGRYEQDNKTDNGKEDVEWIVLEKTSQTALLVSKYALEFRPFSASGAATWAASDLRTWLNKSFFSEAFSKEEQARIPKAIVDPDKNPAYKTDPGAVAKDRVFVLSRTQVRSYFSLLESAYCKATPYAAAHDASDYRVGCKWWTRTPGSTGERVMCIGALSSVVGEPADDNSTAVRPALWITFA